MGRKEYLALCASCHHPLGYGIAGSGPLLLDSDWLRGSEERLIRMVLQGVRDPIKINNEVYNRDGSQSMPPMAMALDDRKIAGILTYVRREWGEFAKPVDPATVTRIRAETKGRNEPWTESELLKIK
ncbi:MAG: cytochrome c [Gemmataceae bacterium]